MPNEIVDTITLKHQIVEWLEDMFPKNIPKPPRSSKQETAEVVVISNRLMSIPKLAYSNLYLFLTSRMMTDELRGIELLVCRGSEDLARTLLSIVQVNEHSLTQGLSSLLANYAAQTQYAEDTWVVQVEQDTPSSWLRGWFPLSKVTTETQKQLKFFTDTKRQLALEVVPQPSANQNINMGADNE